MSEVLFMLFTVVVVGVAIFIYIVNYSSNNRSRSKNLYADGLDLLIAGKRKAAYQNFKKIIDRDSDNIKAYLRLGQVIREGGNAAQALKIHKSLLSRKGLDYFDQIELHKNLALDYLNMENFLSTEFELNEIHKIDKSNEWTLSQLVAVSIRRKKWAKASDYLIKYNKLTGKSDSRKLALYKIQEGRALIKEKQFSEARKVFEKALNINSDVAISYYFIGNTYSAESEEEYQVLIKKHGKSLSEKDNLNEMEKVKELLSKAIPMWIRYAELKPEQAWMVIHLLKDSLFALDRYPEMEVVLKQILKKDSDNIEVIASLSEIYLHRGQESEAMELIDSAIEQDPKSLIVKLIKLKHQSKKQTRGNDIARGLDSIIHFLVTDERFQLYKNTARDDDIIWLYESSGGTESLIL